MKHLQAGNRIHLVDKKDRHYALTLKAGDVFQLSGEKIAHDDLIGQPDGTMVHLSTGKAMLAIYPTLAEYSVKMPRGAQVIYPKDLAMITVWGDIYPGARVLEAGVGSGSLTMALLRAVGDQGTVVSYEMRDEFARTATKNIERYMGAVPNFTLRLGDIFQGIHEDDLREGLFDRIVLDLSEPWQVVPHAVQGLRCGGLYLSFVPTIPQVMQTVAALEETREFALIETFETLFRTWNIQGRSVRPDHRMVAHSGFITVARKIDRGTWETQLPDQELEASPENTEMIMEDQEPHEETQT
ncbi:tRNA (adenine-N1)-methyltransferase [Candidatus Nitrospira salsa]